MTDVILTQDELKSQLNYDTETGFFTWKIRKAIRTKIGSIAGSLKNGYIYIKINDRSYRAHRLAWLYVYGEFPEEQIDHINGVRDDNRLANLRLVNNSQNQQNIFNKKSNNTSGYRGVSFEKNEGKFRAEIMINGNSIFLGRFDDAISASNAYLKAKRKHHEAAVFNGS